MILDVNNFGILTTEEEKTSRQALCGTCPENIIGDEYPLCKQCACPIEYVIKYRFKICPLNKWEA